MITGDVLRTLRHMATEKPPTPGIADLQKRLAELDRERESVLTALEQLKLQCEPELQAASSPQLLADAAATSILSNADKVTLFRSLFRGREDVFPRRWENRKTGKTGYAPACRNEWIRGICEKPRIKCTDCLNQAFVPMTDEVVRKHLQGQDLAKPGQAAFVAGVYALMPNETCWFLAADFDKQFWQRDALAFLSTCRKSAYRPSSNVPAPVMALISGSSSRNRCRHPRRGGSVPIW